MEDQNQIIASPEQTPEDGQKAYNIEEQIKNLKAHMQDTYFEMGRLLKEIRDNRYYTLLGYETIGQWFSSPDISLSPGWAWNVIKMYEVYILKLGKKPEELQSIDYTKLYNILQIVKKHPEDAEEWIDKATNLRRIDLQSEIKSKKISDRVEKIDKLKDVQAVNGVVFGDPIESLKQMAEQSVDLVITSPSPDTKSFVFQDLFSELRRIVKPNGSIFIFADFHNLLNISSAMVMNDYHLVRDIVLAYDTSKQNTGINTLLPYHELLLWASRGDSRLYNGIEVERDVWSMTLNDNPGHPSEKPMDIILRLIKMSSDEGQVVLDPFAGSGNIVVAARTLNRNFVAIESDELWYKIILEKMQNI